MWNVCKLSYAWHISETALVFTLDTAEEEEEKEKEKCVYVCMQLSAAALSCFPGISRGVVI